MYLKQANFGPFRSFRVGATIQMTRGINLLIGPNNCGKSSLLLAIAGVSNLTGLHHLAEAENLGASIEVEMELEPGDCPNGSIQATSVWYRGSTSGGSDYPTVNGARPSPEVAGQLNKAFQSWAARVRYIAPQRAPDPSVRMVAQHQLEPTGKNVTQILHNPAVVTREVRAWLEEWLRASFPEVDRLEVFPADGEAWQIVVFQGGARVSLANCGSGLQQMLLVGLAIKLAPSGALIAVDEPHVFLHPRAERALMKLMADEKDKVFVIATHSPIWVRSSLVASVTLVAKDGADSYAVPVRTDQPGDLHDVVAKLGLSHADLWVSDAFVFVEGKSDKAIFETVLQQSPALQDHSNVAIVSFGMGHSQARRVAKAQQVLNTVLERLSPLTIRYGFVSDGDARSSESPDAHRYVLRRHEIENFFLDPQAIAIVLTQVLEEQDESPAGSVDTNEVHQKLREEICKEMEWTELTPGQEEQALVLVKGKRVLGRIFEHYGVRYHEEVHGTMLAAELAKKSTPLVDEIGRVVSAIRGQP